MSNFLSIHQNQPNSRSNSPSSRSPSPSQERIKKPKNPYIELQNYLSKTYILQHLTLQGDKAIRTLFSDATLLFADMKAFVTPALFQQAKEEVLNAQGLDAFSKINHNSQVWLQFQNDCETVYTSFHQSLPKTNAVGNVAKANAVARLDRLWSETRVERKRNGIKNATQRCPELLIPNDPNDPLCSTTHNPVPVTVDGEIYLKHPRFLNSEAEKPAVDKWDGRWSRSPSPANVATVRNASPSVHNPSAQLFTKHILTSKETTVSEEVDVLKKQVKELSLGMDAAGGDKEAVVGLVSLVEELRAKNADLTKELQASKAREAALSAQLALSVPQETLANPEVKLSLDVSVPKAMSLESAILGHGTFSEGTLAQYHDMVDS